jgi:hypothetical protein
VLVLSRQAVHEVVAVDNKDTKNSVRTMRKMQKMQSKAQDLKKRIRMGSLID